MHEGLPVLVPCSSWTVACERNKRPSRPRGSLPCLVYCSYWDPSIGHKTHTIILLNLTRGILQNSSAALHIFQLSRNLIKKFLNCLQRASNRKDRRVNYELKCALCYSLPLQLFWGSMPLDFWSFFHETTPPGLLIPLRHFLIWLRTYKLEFEMNYARCTLAWEKLWSRMSCQILSHFESAKGGIRENDSKNVCQCPLE